jgi:GNAT superfamily N-acetyltransferase
MAISFRSARNSDLSELLIMMKELQQEDPWSVPFEDAAATKAIAELLREPSVGGIWIICEGGDSIGYVVMAFDFSLEYRGRGAWVDELFVRRTHRGRGIGTEALDFFLQQAKALGVAVVHLEVNRGNRAVELYRRLGFEDHGRYLMTKWVIEKP